MNYRFLPVVHRISPEPGRTSRPAGIFRGLFKETALAEVALILLRPEAVDTGRVTLQTRTRRIISIGAYSVK